MLDKKFLIFKLLKQGDLRQLAGLVYLIVHAVIPGRIEDTWHTETGSCKPTVPSH